MERQRKIDIFELDKLLRDGCSQAEAARKLGVNRSSVFKACKKLELNSSKVVAMEKASQIIDRKLDVVGQLQQINDYANELLDLLMRWNRGDSEALQILESQVSTKLVRVGEEEMELTEFKFGDPRQLALRTMAEIRNQLKLQLEIFQTLYDIETVREFQTEVLETIAGVSEDVRDEIITKLNEKRVIRSALDFNR